jgi:hypothetical protein
MGNDVVGQRPMIYLGMQLYDSAVYDSLTLHYVLIYRLCRTIL